MSALLPLVDMSADRNDVNAPVLRRKSIGGHRQVTAACLAAVACKHAAKLATFDRALSARPRLVRIRPPDSWPAGTVTFPYSAQRLERMPFGRVAQAEADGVR